MTFCVDSKQGPTTIFPSRSTCPFSARVNGLVRRRLWNEQEPAIVGAPAESCQGPLYLPPARSISRRWNYVRTRQGPSTDGHGVRPASIPDRKGGQPVSRPAILREVWGLSQDVDTRAIDNFIVRLRRYVEDRPATPVSPNGPRRRLPLRARAPTGPPIEWPEWLPATRSRPRDTSSTPASSRQFSTRSSSSGPHEIVTFDIGRTNDDASHIKMRINAADASVLDDLLQQLTTFGCHPVRERDALVKPAEKDRCARRTTFIPRRTTARTCG